MKIFVTGINGQLGHDVMLELHRRGHVAVGSGSGETYRGEDEVLTMPYVQMDITDAQEVMDKLAVQKPDAVIHCSAWTAVDAAEDEENREKVYSLNVIGPENIAKACSEIGSKMVYISTDYVFDGQGDRPWKPDDKNYAPLNEYGKSKLEGELTVADNMSRFFIVRTAWVFGLNGKNFVRTMLKLGQTHKQLRVVDDQIGTPTYTEDLARLLVDLVETEKYGYYHATNEGGYISWYEFAKEIFRMAGMNVEVLPVSTEEYGLSKAQRPHNSRLDKSKLTAEGFQRLPTWQNALERYLTQIDEIKN